MKTYIEARDFILNPGFKNQREKNLPSLKNAEIDLPLKGLMEDCSRLPCCFTLQCCYGHFLYEGQKDRHFIGPLPDIYGGDQIEYRIAYLALCIEESGAGRKLLEELRKVPSIDPDNIQFGCATWFWKRQVNSFVLQVEPDRFKHQDTARIDHDEALHIEIIRNHFFDSLQNAVASLI